MVDIKKKKIILSVLCSGGNGFQFAIAWRLIPSNVGLRSWVVFPLSRVKTLAGDNLVWEHHSLVIFKRRTIPLWMVSMNSRICRTEVIT